MNDTKHDPAGRESLNTVPVDAELDIARERQEDVELNIEEFLKNLKLNGRRDERILAFYLIYAVDRFDYEVALDDVIKNYTKGFELAIPQESFAVTLAQGVINQANDLDEQIRPYLKNWKLERLSCCTLLILRMALWELRQSDAIPSIIINDAIELAKRFAEDDAYRFINGILDEIGKDMGLLSDKTNTEGDQVDAGDGQASETFAQDSENIKKGES